MVRRWSKLVVVLAVLVTLVMGVFLKDIKINSNLSGYLPRGDSLVMLFNYIGNEYRGNYLAVAAIEADDVFRNEILKQINIISQKLKTQEGVAGVLSLTNITDIKKTPEGIEVGNIVNENRLPETESELLAFKHYVLSKELYRGHIVSADARSTLIVIRLWEDVDQIKVLSQIKSIINEHTPCTRVYFAGLPFQVLEINRLIRKDLLLLVPLVALVIAGVLFINFRTLAGVLIPLITVGVGIIVTLGLMSIFKVPLTIISNIIPVVLFTVGSAYSIHVLAKLNEILSPEETFLALKGVIKPVTLSAITTAIGFLAFIFGSYLPIIRDFGIFSALGTLILCGLSLTLTPALWVLFNKSHRVIKSPTETTSLKIWRNSFHFILKRKRVVAFGVILTVLVCGFYISKITRASDFITYFRPKTQIRIADQFMNQTFGGSIPLQILVRGDILSPEVLTRIKALSDSLMTIENLSRPQSIVDLIKEASYAIGEEKEIPDSKDKIANLWFLLEGEELTAQMVSPRCDEAIITVMVTGLNNYQRKAIINRIQHFIDQLKSKEIDFYIIGSPLIYDKLDRSLIKSQIQSIFIATVLLLIILSLLTRSFIKGLGGIIPIILTLVVLLGFMGIVKIPLDIATVLVASISLGIGIDYVIHFLARYEKELKNNLSPYNAVINTTESAGWAILVNVLSVTLGFLVLIFAQLIPLARFGVLLAVTMLCAGLSSLNILPLIILKIYQRGGKT
ncbi:MAG: MMPL family transporter [candidate division WOR-3 bacterium]